MNRNQVIERLKLGRMVEAEITLHADGEMRTFIEVRPVVDEDLAMLDNPRVGIESQLIRNSANADVIKEYKVRLCSLHPGWEAYPDDWDHFIYEEKWHLCRTLFDLENYLLEVLGIMLVELRTPGTTESPL